MMLEPYSKTLTRWDAGVYSHLIVTGITVCWFAPQLCGRVHMNYHREKVQNRESALREFFDINATHCPFVWQIKPIDQANLVRKMSQCTTFCT